MVSNASDDFPDPDSPVITTILSRGIFTSTFLRLCSRAPLTWMWSSGICGVMGGTAGDRGGGGRARRHGGEAGAVEPQVDEPHRQRHEPTRQRVPGARPEDAG